MAAHAYPVLQAGIAELFREHPTICGFSIDNAGRLALDCCPRESASEELRSEVMERLLELVEDHPDAAAWLFGRTFARVVH